MKRNLALCIVAFSALLLLSCRHKAPAGVAAEVNGHAITNSELDKIYQTQFPEPIEGSDADQVMAQKLDLLSRLITTEIMWQRAEKGGLTATDADIDTEVNKMKAPYTKEEFEKKLAERHMTLNDLRAQFRRDLTVNKLINKEITSHINITDADVTNYYNANKAVFNSAEPTIHMAQILVTPNPDPNVRNLKNSKAQNAADAKAKIQDILHRLQSGEDFGMLAQSYSEDSATAPNGGDMGFVPTSQLERLSPELRKMLESLQPGGLTGILSMSDGFRVLKVFEKEPAGQRDLNDPRVQQKIRETLLNRKENLLTAAYYETARNNAKIVNYLAQQVVDNAGASK
ncbi:MAG TPA: peptidylprolyl isomerase [Bryobacteraceae bacterium]|nr:peptidylprolyl isomerase [Bryobacteraceae bacterium]